MNARQLDDAIAAHRLDERIVEWRREQYAVEIREAVHQLVSRRVAAAEDVERRKWRPLVDAGGWPCSECRRPIRAFDRWVYDIHGPEHARHALGDS